MLAFHRLALLTISCLIVALVAMIAFSGCGTTQVSLEGANVALYHGGILCSGTVAVPGAPTITVPLDSTTCSSFPPFSFGVHYAGNRVVADSLTIDGVDARLIYVELLRLRIVADSLRVVVAGKGK